MIKLIAMFLVQAFAVNSMAAGTLTFSLQDKFGFQKMQLSEMNGIRDGQLIAGLSATPARSYMKNNQLVMQVGNKTDVLGIQDLGGSYLLKGFFDGTQLVEIQIWPKAFGGFKMKGKVKEIAFEAESNALTKSFLMTWEKNELQIWGVLNPKKDKGACKGSIGTATGSGYEETGKFTCLSQGTLKDSLFKSPQDVIANLVHLLISPD